MNINKLVGYLYIFVGLFVAIYVAGQLLFQILGAVCGLIVAFHGWKMIRPQHASFHSTRAFFFNKFNNDRF